jgi:NAD(P)-dependent dehydrogenase (short-subunit alcohol dehydrogenase family)
MHLTELFDLKGRVAVVTGSSSGLGLQMAEGLAEAGASLVIASRRIDVCESVSEKLRKEHGTEAMAVKMDVTREDEVVSGVEKTVARFGKIDILVNNVGKANIKETLRTSLSEWKQIMDINVGSMFLCCREAGKHMIESRYGKIINIASVYGMRGSDWRNYVKPEMVRELLSYSASKGAVINFTRELAVNWARYNITVNTLSPGCFLTEETKKFCDDYTINKLRDRFPLGRWGEDDDLKGAVVFLASNASKYVTGQNLIVDGGWSAWT